jgi:Zn-dependent M16 (insulinase) family peptidase
MKENSPTKGRRIKWDHEKAIHQEVVDEIQQIQAKMGVPILLHLHISKDIQNLTKNIKEKLEQAWEVLPYHEESKKEGIM